MPEDEVVPLKEWAKIGVYLSPEEKAIVEEAKVCEQRKSLSEFCRVVILAASRRIVAERRSVETQLRGGMPLGADHFIDQVASKLGLVDNLPSRNGKD
jgi:hypothetical protein